MKLLFDQNLSPRLPIRLADLFPGSVHVDSLGLGSAADDVIWNHSLQNGFFVVSKDEDYSQMSVLRGWPPKVIWLLPGNCSTFQVESLLRKRFVDIVAFEQDATVGVLALG